MLVEYLAPGQAIDDVAPLFAPEVEALHWVPDVCLLEVANALRRRFLTDRRFTRSHLENSVGDLLALGLVAVGSSALVRATLTFAEALTTYDASYVALAMARSAPFATLDHGLADTASREGIPVLVPGTPPFSAWVNARRR